jgi:tRNA A37 threonylcarbamoyladenosine modification protein TsaB
VTLPSSLLPWIKDICAEKGLKIADVSQWIVGTGPGSFTGLRLVASMVTGIALNRERGICADGLPSALAIALGAKPADKERVAVLYDGRRGEILLFGAVMQAGEIKDDKVRNVLDASFDFSRLEADFKHFVALSADEMAMKNNLPESIFNCIVFLEHFPISNMFEAFSEDNKSDLSELIYIRPAVFVDPVENRNPETL